jgi:uncharacterized protein (DUF1697 family)
MATLILLIRGINVGTGNRVPMAKLRDLLTGLGYDDVRTHLNSGNAIVRTTASRAKVVDAVESGLADDIGVPAAVVVRSREQVIAAMDRDPFGSIADEGSKHFLGFFADKPTRAKVDAVQELSENADTAPDLARVVDDHLYLWCPNGISKATFSKVNWDRKLGTAVTVRNWNTVAKLVELSAD